MNQEKQFCFGICFGALKGGDKPRPSDFEPAMLWSDVHVAGTSDRTGSCLIEYCEGDGHSASLLVDQSENIVAHVFSRGYNPRLKPPKLGVKADPGEWRRMGRASCRERV